MRVARRCQDFGVRPNLVPTSYLCAVCARRALRIHNNRPARVASASAKAAKSIRLKRADFARAHRSARGLRALIAQFIALRKRILHPLERASRLARNATRALIALADHPIQYLCRLAARLDAKWAQVQRCGPIAEHKLGRVEGAHASDMRPPRASRWRDSNEIRLRVSFNYTRAGGKAHVYY